jgi:hypothetical protein
VAEGEGGRGEGGGVICHLGVPWAAAIRLVGLVAAVALMTPLASGFFRGLRDVGASADTSQAPYQAGELVRALDYHRNGFTSYRRMAWPMRNYRFCGTATPGPVVQSEIDMLAFSTLDLMLRQRRQELEDVRTDVVLTTIPKPMVTLYTSCLRESLFAPFCAARVKRLIQTGLEKARVARRNSLKLTQDSDDRLLCTYFAGQAALAAQAPQEHRP